MGSIRELLHGVRATMRLLPRAGRSAPAVTLTQGFLFGALPLGMTVATAVAVGAATGVAAGGLDTPAGDRLVTAMWVYLGVFLLQSGLGVFTDVYGSWLSREVDGQLRERTMRAAMTPAGVQHLEDAGMRRSFDTARNLAPMFGLSPGHAASMLPSVIAERVRLIGYLLVLGYLWWPLALGFAAVTVVNQGEMWQAVVRPLLASSFTESPTFAWYHRDLAVSPSSAKEARVFGWSGWLNERYRGSMLAMLQRGWSQRHEFTPAIVGVLLVNGALIVVGLAWLGNAADQGDIGAGDLALGIAALMALSPRITGQDIIVAYGANAVTAIEAVEASVADERQRARGSLPAPVHTTSVHFDSVTFRYPGAERDVLRDFDFELQMGERTALVGVNGAGKTTVVKLLCKLYAPTGGRILVDGVDLAELDPDSWRAQVSVLFQDFVHYELSARDNVRVGAIDTDEESVDSVLDLVAAQSGVASAVAALPTRWDTTLSSAYKGGADLSGGEWQRLALARALFAVEGGARVMVLDEPSANLDVRAEADLYGRFVELTRREHDDGSGALLATLLISHRFSTVRQADRIVVLDDGRVVEDGSHETLLERGGIYARMFNAQAARFGASEPT